jgi:hypothetical protein
VTRKDYILIAAALQAARADIIAKENEVSHRDLLDGVNYATEFLADALGRDNPRFDVSRFLKAAGVQS